MRVGLLVLFSVFVLGRTAGATGHTNYGEMMERARLRSMRARIDAAYSCKRRGEPLLRIDRSASAPASGAATGSGAAATQLVMYRGGAVQLVDGDVTLWACVDRRVNGWVRWQLANVSWKATGAGTCSPDAAGATRFTFAGRERFIECDGGKALGPKARERLAEIEAALLSAARKM